MSLESTPLLQSETAKVQKRVRVLTVLCAVLLASSAAALTAALVVSSRGCATRFGAQFAVRGRVDSQGDNGTLWFLLTEGGTPFSLWHDVSLNAGGGGGGRFNMVAEIPVGGTAKMEMTATQPLAPIRQAVKNGVPRFNPAYPFIYGAFPQTWESPHHMSPELNATGDNDPLDCCVVGSAFGVTGSVLAVKIIGALGMIDNGEADWKVVAIDQFDPHANDIWDEATLEAHYPGALNATRTYFLTYKSPPPVLADNGKLFPADFTVALVGRLHAQWAALTEADGLNLVNTQLRNAFTISVDAARAIVFGAQQRRVL